MELISVRQEATGVIALGQVATGFIAVGQMATGVIAIGQIARGVVAIGQVSVGGVYALGMAAVAPGYAVGMLAVAARTVGLLPLSLIPKRTRFALEPVSNSYADFDGGRADQGMIEVRLSREHGRLVAREGGEIVPVVFEGDAEEEAMRIAMAPHPVARVEIRAEDRPGSDSLGYRAAPETRRGLVVRSVFHVPPPPSSASMRVFEWIMRSFAMAAVFIAFFYFVVMPIYEFATS